MPRGEAKIFECVTCSRKYSKRDAERSRYFPLPRVCKKCYRKMARADPKIYCFGKPAEGKLPGYSPQNEVCNLICPDRTQCISFITAKGKQRG